MRVRSVADYQFGRGDGAGLFPANVKISYSKATGRIRYVSLNGERLATHRPTDGLLSISICAARFLAENSRAARCFVTVRDDVAKFIAEGGDVFAAHVVDGNNRVLAVGRALLSGLMMQDSKTGVAVTPNGGDTSAG